MGLFCCLAVAGVLHLQQLFKDVICRRRTPTNAGGSENAPSVQDAFNK